ncbi:hypothetical protein ABZ876_34170 [Streptomyces sp. NPDC046931]|uniref:hypothetical protein n=1 Tax=Streptomyces sp. NPDC046931 TaxID=3154806 RepID=UPI0033EB7869
MGAGESRAAAVPPRSIDLAGWLMDIARQLAAVERSPPNGMTGPAGNAAAGKPTAPTGTAP